MVLSEMEKQYPRSTQVAASLIPEIQIANSFPFQEESSTLTQMDLSQNLTSRRLMEDLQEQQNPSTHNNSIIINRGFDIRTFDLQEDLQDFQQPNSDSRSPQILSQESFIDQSFSDELNSISAASSGRHLDGTISDPLVISGSGSTFRNTVFYNPTSQWQVNNYLITVDSATWVPNQVLLFQNCSFKVQGNFIYSLLPIKIVFTNCTFELQNTTSLVYVDYSANTGNFSCDTDTASGTIQISNSTLVDTLISNSYTSTPPSENQLIYAVTRYDVIITTSIFKGMSQNHVIKVRDVSCQNALFIPQQLQFFNNTIDNSNIAFDVAYSSSLDRLNQYSVTFSQINFQNINTARSIIKYSQTLPSWQPLTLSSLVFQNINSAFTQPLISISANGNTLALTTIEVRDSTIPSFGLFQGANSLSVQTRMLFQNLVIDNLAQDLTTQKPFLAFTSIRSMLSVQRLAFRNVTATRKALVKISDSPVITFTDLNVTQVTVNSTDMIEITSAQSIDMQAIYVDSIIQASTTSQNSALRLVNQTLNFTRSSFRFQSIQLKNSQIQLIKGISLFLLNSTDTSVYNISVTDCSFSNNLYSNYDLLSLSPLGSTYFNLVNERCINLNLSTSCTSSQFYDYIMRTCTACPTGCSTCQSQRKCLTCQRTDMLIQNDLCQCPAKQYYTESSGSPQCIKCADRCLTCSNIYQCLTYDYCPNRFQTLNSSRLCSFKCTTGYFIDSQTCGTCSDSNCAVCNMRGTTQDCARCQNGFYLDLSTYQCVASCPSNSKQIETFNTVGQIGNSIRYCRPFQNDTQYLYHYYLNGSSDSQLSLGTKEYPYINIDTAAKEMINFMTEPSTQVFFFLARNTTYRIHHQISPVVLLNIMNFTIMPFGPHYLPKPLINYISLNYFYPDSLVYGISESTYNFTKRVSLGDVSASDAASLFVRFNFLNSNANFKEIDFQSLMLSSQLYNANFLALKSVNKTLHFDNCTFDFDGQGWEIYFQIQIYITNSVFNLTNIYSGFWFEISFDCTSTMGAFSDITIENSRFIARQQRANSNLLYYYSYGHVTIRNNTFENCSFNNQDTRPFFNINPSTQCNPYNITQRITFADNQLINLTESNLVVSWTFSSLLNSTRQYFFENNTIINSVLNKNLLLATVTNSSVISVKNNTFINSKVPYGFYAARITADTSTINFANNSLINSSLDDFIYFVGGNNIIVQNLLVSGVSGTGSITTSSAIIRASRSNSGLQVSNLTIKDSSFAYGMAMYVETARGIQIRDSTINNISISQSDLFNINQLQRVMIFNISIRGLSKSSDAAKYIFSIPFLNLSSGHSVFSLRNMTLQNVQSSFLIIQSANSNGISSEQFNLTLSDLNIYDNSLTKRDNMVYLGAISYRQLKVTLTNLNFTNNTLVNGRFLTVLSNMRNISMSNTTFANNSGQIIELQPTNINSANQLTFDLSDCTFSGNYGGSDATIQVASNTVLYISKSTFLENYSVGRGSVIFGDYQAAQIYVQDCLFKNNYAYQGGLFYMSYSSSLVIQNSQILENFAVTGGVGYINNNGVIIIRDSSVIAKNQALNTCIFFVINSILPSFIQNSTIQENDQAHAIVPKSSFIDISSGYKFLRIDFFQQMKVISSKVQRTISEQSDSAIQVISASFNMTDTNITSNDNLLSASTNSLVGIKNVKFEDLQASGQIFQSILSEIDIQQLYVDNITHVVGQTFYLLRAEGLSNLKLKQSSFSNIVSMLVYVTESTLDARDVQFVNITSDSTFGSIFSIDNSQVYMDKMLLENISSYQISPIFNLDTNQVSLTNTQVSRFDKSLFQMRSGNAQVQNFTAFSFIRNLKRQSNPFFLSSSLVFSVSDADFLIKESSIYGIATNYSSPAIYHSLSDGQTERFTLTVQDCNFTNNLAQQSAGAIQTVNTNLKLMDSLFDNNTANMQQAGALLLNCDYQIPTPCSFEISNTSFINNTAKTQGGAISYNYYEPVIDAASYFFNNSAIYGNETASYAVSLNLYDHDSISNDDQFSVLNAEESLKQYGLENAILIELLEPQVSGFVVTQSLSFVLEDQDGTPIKSDNSSAARVDPIDQTNVQVLKSRTVQAVQGVYTFDDFILIAKPGTDVLLKISSDAIDEDKILSAYPELGNSITQIYIKISLRICQIGEYQTDDLKCIQCSDGFYTLSDNQTKCHECPDNAQCENGFQIIPNAGYWRENATSTSLFQCFNQDACLSKYNDACAPGYGGNLCQSCQKYNGTWYSLQSSSTCAKCPEYSSNLWKLVGVCVLIVAYFIALISINIKTAGKQKLTTVYMRILTNYFQILTLAQSYDLSWEYSLNQFLQYISIIAQASEFVVSQDCFYRDTSSAIHPQYLKMILAFALPLILIVAFTIFWLCWSRCKGGLAFKSNLTVSVIIMVFMAMPSITSISFAVLNCKDIFNDGDKYLIADMSIKCWEGEHAYYAYYIALPIICLWVIGIPILALVVLTQNRIALKESQNITRYGFLYVGLNHESFFWEILIHFRKVVMISINVYFTSFVAQYRALVGFIILIIYIELLQKAKPYQTERINSLEFYANIAAFSVFYGGLFFISSNLPTAVIVLFLVVILILNFIFWLMWINTMFSRQIDILISFISTKCCPSSFRRWLKKLQELREEQSSQNEYKQQNQDDGNSFNQPSQSFISAHNQDIISKQSEKIDDDSNSLYSKTRLAEGDTERKDAKMKGSQLVRKKTMTKAIFQNQNREDDFSSITYIEAKGKKDKKQAKNKKPKKTKKYVDLPSTTTAFDVPSTNTQANLQTSGAPRRDQTRVDDTNYESISEVHSARKSKRRKNQNEPDSSRQFIKPAQGSGEEIQGRKNKGKNIKVQTQLKDQLDSDVQNRNYAFQPMSTQDKSLFGDINTPLGVSDKNIAEKSFQKSQLSQDKDQHEPFGSSSSFINQSYKSIHQQNHQTVKQISQKYSKPPSSHERNKQQTGSSNMELESLESFNHFAKNNPDLVEKFRGEEPSKKSCKSKQKKNQDKESEKQEVQSRPGSSINSRGRSQIQTPPTDLVVNRQSAVDYENGVNQSISSKRVKKILKNSQESQMEQQPVISQQDEVVQNSQIMSFSKKDQFMAADKEVDKSQSNLNYTLVVHNSSQVDTSQNISMYLSQEKTPQSTSRFNPISSHQNLKLKDSAQDSAAGQSIQSLTPPQIKNQNSGIKPSQFMADEDEKIEDYFKNNMIEANMIEQRESTPVQIPKGPEYKLSNTKLGITRGVTVIISSPKIQNEVINHNNDDLDSNNFESQPLDDN